MSILVFVLATGLIFLIADALMLPTVNKPLFERHIGDGLRRHPVPLGA